MDVVANEEEGKAVGVDSAGGLGLAADVRGIEALMLGRSCATEGGGGKGVDSLHTVTAERVLETVEGV